MIIKVQGGGGGTYANTGTSEVVVNYLQHEDFKRMQENRKIEHFFSQAEDRVKPQEVTNRIDTNRKGLKAKEAKFYVITVAPSVKELARMGATKQEQAEAMKNYIRREVMPRYADGFKKGIKADDLVYFAKIHFERDERDGEDLHAHIIVSHKTKNNGKAISPNTNHTGKKNAGVVKGGFDRKEWFQGCEQGFDILFQYKREKKEHFAYLNAVKNGSPKEIKEVIHQLNKKMEQGREQKMQPVMTAKLNDSIEKAVLKETTSGTHLLIKYKDNTGETHRLTEKEVEDIRIGRYPMEAIANKIADNHREKEEERKQGKTNKGGLSL
jgi:hypothetical protein